VTTPTPETLVSTLARKYRLDVNTSSTTTADWKQVRGVSEFTPTVDSNLEDDSDYDSDGWASQTKTQLAWAIEATLMRKIGVTSGAYDPGQEALRVAGESFGTDGVVHVRWYDREGGAEAYEGYAEVSWAPEGGSTTALSAVSVTLTGKGARSTITNPAAPVPPTP
jgi:hypothetical protein